MEGRGPSRSPGLQLWQEVFRKSQAPIGQDFLSDLLLTEGAGGTFQYLLDLPARGSPWHLLLSHALTLPFRTHIFAGGLAAWRRDGRETHASACPELRWGRRTGRGVEDLVF